MGDFRVKGREKSHNYIWSQNARKEDRLMICPKDK